MEEKELETIETEVGEVVVGEPETITPVNPDEPQEVVREENTEEEA